MQYGGDMAQKSGAHFLLNTSFASVKVTVTINSALLDGITIDAPSLMVNRSSACCFDVCCKMCILTGSDENRNMTPAVLASCCLGMEGELYADELCAPGAREHINDATFLPLPLYSYTILYVVTYMVFDYRKWAAASCSVTLKGC